MITIQSALTPTAETPVELDSPVPVDLWKKRDWKELKLWFLEENEDEDTQSLAPLIPQGESLQVFQCILTPLSYHAICSFLISLDIFSFIFASQYANFVYNNFRNHTEGNVYFLEGLIAKSRMSHVIGCSSFQVSIKSICLTLEAGVGHHTIPMLLAKSSFSGDVKNWSTLINLHSELNLEVRHKSTTFIF